MKSLTYIFLLGLISLTMWSCTDQELDPVYSLNGAPTITAPTAGATLTLLEANAADIIPDVTWTAADFGFQSGTTYLLEMDLAGNNFAEPVALGNVNALTISGMTQATLNNLLLGKGLEGETPANVELRVVATVSDDVPAQISPAVAITIVPYTATVIIPQLQVPGSYQGWDPANNNTIIFSRKNDGRYEGYLYFGDDNAFFKYTQGPSWDTNWGDNGGDGTLEPGGADIPAAAAGVYKLNVNLTALTHTYSRTDWGLIGSATPNGWDSDQDMTYDPGTGLFSVTLDLVPGEIKFRANDDWALNFGDDGANTSLEYDGANIVIAEGGNYTVTLEIVGVTKYTYTVTKN